MRKSYLICYNVDGPWGHYAKWNKSDVEKQILYDFKYMWNIKNQTHRNGDQIDGFQEEGQGNGGKKWTPRTQTFSYKKSGDVT